MSKYNKVYRFFRRYCADNTFYGIKGLLKPTRYSEAGYGLYDEKSMADFSKGMLQAAQEGLKPYEKICVNKNILFKKD